MATTLDTTLYMRPDRNLALELVRVTEAGAMAAGRWVGRGDKEGGDGAAVDAMRQLVSSVSMRGMGGALQARLAPIDDVERQKAIDAVHDLDRILSTEGLVW